MNIDNINGIFFITVTAAFREQPILGTLPKAGYKQNIRFSYNHFFGEGAEFEPSHVPTKSGVPHESE